MTNKRITNGYCLRTPHDRCCSFTLKKYILKLSWEGESIELVLKTTGCKYFESLLVMADQTVLYKNDVMCRYINIMGHSVQYFCFLKKCKKNCTFSFSSSFVSQYIKLKKERRRNQMKN